MRRSMIKSILMSAEPRLTIEEIEPATWRVTYNAPLPLIHHCRQEICPHRDAPLVSIIEGKKPCLNEEKERANRAISAIEGH